MKKYYLMYKIDFSYYAYIKKRWKSGSKIKKTKSKDMKQLALIFEYVYCDLSRMIWLILDFE